MAKSEISMIINRFVLISKMTISSSIDEIKNVNTVFITPRNYKEIVAGHSFEVLFVHESAKPFLTKHMLSYINLSIRDIPDEEILSDDFPQMAYLFASGMTTKEYSIYQNKFMKEIDRIKHKIKEAEASKKIDQKDVTAQC